jgi:hypothetical protein
MRLSVVAGVLAGLVLSMGPAGAQLPLLEKYTLESVGERRGSAYELYDQSLGGGDAEARLELRRESASTTLSLRVWRKVRRGDSSFALLGEKVEVRGFDLEGTQIFSHDYSGLEKDGIYFGDSRSGRWQRTLRGIPAGVRRLEVTFLGNYE